MYLKEEVRNTPDQSMHQIDILNKMYFKGFTYS